MTYISKNFTLEELCYTSCGKPNFPDEQAICNLCYGVNNILQPLRYLLGKPIKVNSGFRSLAVNKAVGGVGNSQHLYGEAADIHIDSCDMDKAMFFLRDNIYCDQVLQGRTFIHISWSIKKPPRHQFINNYYNY